MIYQGRGTGETRTKKRRPPARIANRLQPHLKRWRATDNRRSAELRAAGVLQDDDEIRFVINHAHDGQPLAGKIRSAWDGILADAGLGDDVVRHSLRHTAATWLMQQGTDHWQAAGWLGMTLEQLENNYGHHHPDFQGEVASGVQREAVEAGKRLSKWADCFNERLCVAHIAPAIPALEVPTDCSSSVLISGGFVGQYSWIWRQLQARAKRRTLLHRLPVLNKPFANIADARRSARA